MIDDAPTTLPSFADVAATIDHSLLRPELTNVDIDNGCATAGKLAVASVCVRPLDVERAVRKLVDSAVRVGSVVGFPHGSATTAIKVTETRQLLDAGATEIDMVLAIGRLRSGETRYVLDDIAAVVQEAAGRTVKVILETAYLDDEQKHAGCRLSEQAGAAFVKTSTGFASAGATLADIRLMRSAVSDAIQVKAAGGVRTLDVLLELLEAGATRFGATATQTILDDLGARHRGERLFIDARDGY